MTLKSLLSTSLLTSLALAATHDIDVGNEQGALAFYPSTTTAQEGDTLVFHFYRGHDVVQGVFDKPCQYAPGGFYSGFPETSGGGESKEQFVVQVNSTDPLFFYCSAPGHCKGGMVGVVNPSPEETLEKYSQGAKTGQNETPKVEDGTGGSFTSGGSSGSSSSASASVSASSSGSASASATSGSASATSGSESATSAASSATGSASAGSSAAGTKQAGIGAMGIMAMLSGLVAWY